MGWGFDGDGPQDPRVLLELENAVRQTRRLGELIGLGLADPRAFRLTPAIICDLNRHAVEGLVEAPGVPRRRSDLEISGSRHRLPAHEDVPRLLEEMCDFVSANLEAEALFLAAYVLWRICWIHPFDDGNGRTARAASYLVLCIRLEQELPGALPIPSRIKHAPRAYVRALEAADAAWASGHLDVSVLQELLTFYLQLQISDAPPTLPPEADVRSAT